MTPYEFRRALLLAVRRIRKETKIPWLRSLQITAVIAALFAQYTASKRQRFPASDRSVTVGIVR